MSVSVQGNFDATVTFDNADSWRVEDSDLGSGVILHVVKVAVDTTPEKILASFNTNAWVSVRKDPKQDKEQLVELLTELLKDVDDGNYSNQSEEWKDRADSLLNP